MTEDLNRIAGAPISWGVCEVPGWGYQLPADHPTGNFTWSVEVEDAAGTTAAYQPPGHTVGLGALTILPPGGAPAHSARCRACSNRRCGCRGLRCHGTRSLAPVVDAVRCGAAGNRRRGVAAPALRSGTSPPSARV